MDLLDQMEIRRPCTRTVVLCMSSMMLLGKKSPPILALFAPEDLELYKKAKIEINEDPSVWQSHTVIVVDRSGSMRKGDFYGARNRLKAVWGAVANDYLFPLIEEGRGSLYDVVSIVAFGDDAYEILSREPVSWVLYNKICKIHASCQQHHNPFGHGNYLPGLQKVEQILNDGQEHCLPLSLIFLSDGRPSDHFTLGVSQEEADSTIEDSVAELASKYGRRLHFSAVGIGGSTDFAVLHRMVEAATDHGVDAVFSLPSQSCASLGTSFTASATALATTQAEMLNEASNGHRKMRRVVHESKKSATTIPKAVNGSMFDIYPLKDVVREK